MQHKNWQCVKCGNTRFDTDQFRATGGMFAKIFDVQNKRFVNPATMRNWWLLAVRKEDFA